MGERSMRVGLTGGIASGKSTVAALFAELGVAVIDLDLVARAVVAPGSPLLEQVLQRFGPQLRRANGTLDRSALRHRVFTDSAERVALEHLVQPAIITRAEALSLAITGPYYLLVNPLLAERRVAMQYDRVLVVDCDEQLQRKRLQERDGAEPAEVERMLAAQATRAERLEVADDIIQTDAGDHRALGERVRELHRLYLRLAADRAARAQ